MLARDRLSKELENWSGLTEVEERSGLTEELFNPPAAKPLLFRHFPLSCALIALLSLGVNPKSKTVLASLHNLLQLQDASGGWCVAKGQMPKTWATLNATVALDMFKSAVYGEGAHLRI